MQQQRICSELSREYSKTNLKKLFGDKNYEQFNRKISTGNRKRTAERLTHEPNIALVFGLYQTIVGKAISK